MSSCAPTIGGDVVEALLNLTRPDDDDCPSVLIVSSSADTSDLRTYAHVGRGWVAVRDRESTSYSIRC
jgi:hypothetical protein